MSVDIVLGLQRGDEGKGRIVDLIAEQYDIVARFNGGPNAGHTVSNGFKIPLRLHQLPSGLVRPKIKNVIGNGMLLDPIRLLDEIKDVTEAGVAISPKNLIISDLTHLILPHHVSLDEIREAGAKGQGSTKRGIAFGAVDKYERIGVRAELLRYDNEHLEKVVREGLESVASLRESVGLPPHDPVKDAAKWIAAASQLAPYVTDTIDFMQISLGQNKKVLAEGAQAFGLDIEFGMYPYVTSSHTTTGGAVFGLGIDPHEIKRVIGVVKAIKSHVGGGPFVTEIKDSQVTTKIRGRKGDIDSEYGASTGRERQVGYLDLPELRRAVSINGVTEIALTKLDALHKFGDSMKIAVEYELDGEKLRQAPSSANLLAACNPVYQDWKLWDEDVSKMHTVEELPKQAQKLLNFLADELGVPVTIVGIGPERDQVIWV